MSVAGAAFQLAIVRCRLCLTANEVTRATVGGPAEFVTMLLSTVAGEFAPVTWATLLIWWTFPGRAFFTDAVTVGGTGVAARLAMFHVTTPPVSPQAPDPPVQLT